MGQMVNNELYKFLKVKIDSLFTVEKKLQVNENKLADCMEF